MSAASLSPPWTWPTTATCSPRMSTASCRRLPTHRCRRTAGRTAPEDRKRDRHRNRELQRGGVATLRLAGSVHFVDRLLGRGRTGVPGGVPCVGIARHQSQHAGSLAGQQQRWPRRSRAARNQLAVARGVVLAGEIDLAVAEQRTDDLQRLFESTYAVVEGKAEGIELGLMPAGAEAQREAPATDFVQGGGHLGHERRVAELAAGYQRAKLDALRRFGQRREHGPALPDTIRGPTGPAI